MGLTLLSASFFCEKRKDSPFWSVPCHFFYFHISSSTFFYLKNKDEAWGNEQK